MKKVIAICLVTILCVCGCEEKKEEKVPELIEAVGVDFDTVEVKKMDLSGINSYVAQIMPVTEDLSFKTSGTVADLYVSVGEHVKKGQLLIELSSAGGQVKELKKQLKEMIKGHKNENQQSQYDIEMLKETIRNLKSQLKKSKSPQEKDGLKKQIIEKEEDVKISQEKLRQQKENQSVYERRLKEKINKSSKSGKNSKLYAPIEGDVVSTTGGQGYMVQGGDKVISIANMHKARLKTDYIGESELAKASKYLAVIDGKKYEVEAEIEEVSQIEAERGEYPEESWFNFVNPNVNVKIGGSASLELYTDSVEGAVVVPSNALFKGSSEKYVYVVQGETKTKRVVEVGTETDAYVQIISGVKEGERVYVED